MLLVQSDSWAEWQDIVGKVLPRKPKRWRKARDREARARKKLELKHHIGDLWKLFVTSYNASPGSIAEAVSKAEAVTEASRRWEGVTIVMAPIFPVDCT